MNKELKVAVCSRSFSKNPVLRQELLDQFPNAKFNNEGISLKDKALIDFLNGAKAAIDTDALGSLESNVWNGTIIGSKSTGKSPRYI